MLNGDIGRSELNRLLDNTNDKITEIKRNIDDYIESQLDILSDFILSHDDNYFEDEKVCPQCGTPLKEC